MKAIIGVVSLCALAASQASANVVSISGSITGGPVGTPVVVPFGNPGPLEAFTFSAPGISVTGFSRCNSAQTTVGQASGGFGSTTFDITSNDAVDFTLRGQYEFASGGAILEPVTFSVYQLTGNSRGRALTVTIDAIVDGNDQEDQGAWQGGLPGPFFSQVSTPPVPFSAAMPTVSMEVFVRIQVGAGTQPVHMAFTDCAQRALWEIPAPGAAGMLLGWTALASRRRRS